MAVVRRLVLTGYVLCPFCPFCPVRSGTPSWPRAAVPGTITCWVVAEELEPKSVILKARLVKPQRGGMRAQARGAVQAPPQGKRPRRPRTSGRSVSQRSRGVCLKEPEIRVFTVEGTARRRPAVRDLCADRCCASNSGVCSPGPPVLWDRPLRSGPQAVCCYQLPSGV